MKVLCVDMTSSAMFVKVEERPEWGREGGKFQYDEKSGVGEDKKTTGT